MGDALSEFDLRGAASLISRAVAALNRDLEATQPWVLAKAEAASGAPSGALDSLLARHVRSAVAIAVAARPIVPALSAELLDQLGETGRPLDPRRSFNRLELR